MKIIVAGSREYTNKKKIFKILDKVYEVKPDIEIVTGLARGPDSYGKEWAIENDVPYHEFPADWDRYGKSAGYRRNQEMAYFSDMLIAFHLNTRGTQHMINIAYEEGLKVAIIRK
jgi:hypothetical protein